MSTNALPPAHNHQHSQQLSTGNTQQVHTERVYSGQLSSSNPQQQLVQRMPDGTTLIVSSSAPSPPISQSSCDDTVESVVLPAPQIQYIAPLPASGGGVNPKTAYRDLKRKFKYLVYVSFIACFVSNAIKLRCVNVCFIIDLSAEYFIVFALQCTSRLRSF